jgi:Protein of unknown function (DUF3096)
LPRGSWGGSSPISISDLDLRFVFFRTGLASHGADACSGIIFRTNPTKPLVTLRKRRAPYPNQSTTQEIVMTLTAEHLSPIVALIAGMLILILPSLLNYVVAIYLIVTGLIGLNGIYHFIN